MNKAIDATAGMKPLSEVLPFEISNKSQFDMDVHCHQCGANVNSNGKIVISEPFKDIHLVNAVSHCSACDIDIDMHFRLKPFENRYKVEYQNAQGEWRVAHTESVSRWKRFKQKISNMMGVA